MAKKIGKFLLFAAAAAAIAAGVWYWLNRHDTAQEDDFLDDEDDFDDFDDTLDIDEPETQRSYVDLTEEQD
ncbi:MAG: hypothetical protein IJC59_05945 [Lachnospiraceae bacterium]|nr:hypothetical protein [Lachnospiraceae bacterium]